MNENRLSPDGETASPLQSYQGNSSLLRRGMDRLAVLRAGTGTLAATESESRLLWKFAAYGNNIEDTSEGRPPAVIDRIENLPAELKDRRQWLCWDWGLRFGRELKWEWCAGLPISPISAGTGYVDDPATWGTFSEAATFAINHGLAGVGFVLAREDPYFFVDCLDCRDPNTGILTRRVMEILAQLNSYAEVTPDGYDTLIVGRGSPPSPYLLSDIDTEFPVAPEDRKLSPSIDVTYYRHFRPLTGLIVNGTPPEIMEREIDSQSLRGICGQIAWVDASYRGPVLLDYRIAGDRVLVSPGTGGNVCLDIETGSRLSENDVLPDDRVYERIPDNYLDEERDILVEWESYNDKSGPSVWAIKASTHETLWKLSFEDLDIDPEESLNVLVEDGIVYVRTTILDDLLALDEQTGEELWYFDWSEVQSFELIDSIVLVYSRDAIYAVDRKSGEIAWQYEMVASARWRAVRVIDGPHMYVGDDQKFLHAIDLATGVCLWRCSTLSFDSAITALTNDLIILKSWGWIRVIDRETGELQWELGGNAPLNYSPSNPEAYVREFVVSGDTVVAVVSDRYVVALEAATGKERWRFDVGEEVSLLEVTDEAVFVKGAHVLYALRKT